MAKRTYRVRVMVPATEARAKYADSARHSFVVVARTHDAAMQDARRRIVANGFEVRSSSHAPGNAITLLVDPVDAAKAVRS